MINRETCIGAAVDPVGVVVQAIVTPFLKRAGTGNVTVLLPPATAEATKSGAVVPSVTPDARRLNTCKYASEAPGFVSSIQTMWHPTPETSIGVEPTFAKKTAGIYFVFLRARY